MFDSLQALLAPAVAERLTLIFNHVLGSEITATERLRAHAGRTLVVAVTDWPSLLPVPPPLAWRVTPAGLLEWQSEWAAEVRARASPQEPRQGPGAASFGAAAPAPDLTLQIEATNPALVFMQTLTGTLPKVQIEGDAQFAGDVNWLLQNLRWDVGADLERLLGPLVAEQVRRIGASASSVLRSAVEGAGKGFSQGAAGLQELSERLRSRSA